MNVLLCPLSDPGYLYPAIAIGRELHRRGHTVTLLGRARVASVAAAAGLTFVPVENHGDTRAFQVARWFDSGAAQFAAIVRAVRESGADVLVTSVLCHGALLAGEVLDLPVVVVGLAAHLWTYQTCTEQEPRPLALREWRQRVIVGRYQGAREQAGLSARHDRSPSTPLVGSGLLLRGDPALEVPGGVLPDGVHHVGPCWWEPPADQAEVEAITARLDRVGKPVVYVHLGRIFQGRSLWPRLNAAFTDGPFQAVVEQGRSADPQPAADADIVLVRKPWMGPLVDRAELVLTNATSAPVLGALRAGRPLVVAPAGSEQPLLAAACLRAGVAVRFPEEIGAETTAVLAAAGRDRELRARARTLGARLRAAGGPVRAADLVQALTVARSTATG